MYTNILVTSRNRHCDPEADVCEDCGHLAADSYIQLHCGGWPHPGARSPGGLGSAAEWSGPVHGPDTAAN